MIRPEAPREAPATVNEGIPCTSAARCLLCGGGGIVLFDSLRDRIFGVPGRWSLRFCPECILAWLNPVPLPTSIGALYPGYYTHDSDGAAGTGLSRLRRVLDSLLSRSLGYAARSPVRPLDRVLGSIHPLRDYALARALWLPAVPGGRLLDIGCGNGEFLDRMRNLGWTVTGLEPDGRAAERARADRCLEVIEGFLDSPELRGRFFDAVTLNHVIEHVPDPVRVLAQARNLLVAGGALAVLTPNCESLARRVFRNSWRGWEPPRHVHIFSAESLAACADRAGFARVRARSTARAAHWMWAECMQSLGSGDPASTRLRSPRKVRAKLVGFAFLALESLLSALLPSCGEEILLTAVNG